MSPWNKCFFETYPPGHSQRHTPQEFPPLLQNFNVATSCFNANLIILYHYTFFLALCQYFFRKFLLNFYIFSSKNYILEILFKICYNNTIFFNYKLQIRRILCVKIVNVVVAPVLGGNQAFGGEVEFADMTKSFGLVLISYALITLFWQLKKHCNKSRRKFFTCFLYSINIFKAHIFKSQS